MGERFEALLHGLTLELLLKLTVQKLRLLFLLDRGTLALLLLLLLLHTFAFLRLLVLAFLVNFYFHYHFWVLFKVVLHQQDEQLHQLSQRYMEVFYSKSSASKPILVFLVSFMKVVGVQKQGLTDYVFIYWELES